MPSVDCWPGSTGRWPSTCCWTWAPPCPFARDAGKEALPALDALVTLADDGRTVAVPGGAFPQVSDDMQQ
ncbi:MULTISPECIES: hypothetical protein [Streptomyces]|uniref:hypothetical protein n=1 Tax=Streptomyces TaxID=1883 RepID=UPI00211B63D8|nr:MULTISPECIES: hypothetical protein [Streptomyces]MDX3583538.1 hypothetical protein [Streptomyces europaeiscabiei]MDX3629191.1 hypothetical protein [Streptomyces europaeiscabiei]MDX3647191.1 hypothetical protein [Streptomyces europaeiscabiei]WUD36003.1 hypothetical protein OG858_34285 [Streptomyces europaeiscabiei]